MNLLTWPQNGTLDQGQIPHVFWPCGRLSNFSGKTQGEVLLKK